MDLEKVTAKIRPRKQWEAIDLGIAMVQKHSKQLYAIWFIITFPVFILLSAIFRADPFWVIIIFWLLKPLWERPLLHFLSRDLFGERLTIKDCVKAFFKLAIIQWFASLTWRRLSFTRSLDLPVIQLEGLKGAKRGQRIKVIHSAGSGGTVWLTILFSMSEMLFYFAFLSLVYLLLPAPFTENIEIYEWVAFESEEGVIAHLLNLISYLSMSLIAPFYVAAGFSIYLNQRTLLEAWDVELAFRRLAKRLGEVEKHRTVRLASITCFVIFIGLLNPMNSQKLLAEEGAAAQKKLAVTESESELTDILKQLNMDAEKVSNNKSAHQLAKEQITVIKGSEDFGGKERIYFDRRRDSGKKVKEYRDREPAYYNLWNAIGRLISFVVEFALWVFVVLIVIFLIAKYGKFINGIKPKTNTGKAKPRQLFGLDMRNESLPDKPWNVAATLIEKGDVRQGVSLLYRATLIWFIENSAVVIKEGDTELECLRKIKPYANGEQLEISVELTGVWRKLAYAHLMPEKEKVLQLCQQWPLKISQMAAPESKMGAGL
ncbi:hypothetical protein [Aliikangiella sp. G2MR2-5]|uniref:hypothetical protein n=1 Tax=Aliikangiella sp. G2MR2-5 TaxID=2788943 RepID=UPI0018ABF112|nr:hypothetical protein [Aliikangiella sp. G2MR2-5]